MADKTRRAESWAAVCVLLLSGAVQAADEPHHPEPAPHMTEHHISHCAFLFDTSSVVPCSPLPMRLLAPKAGTSYSYAATIKKTSTISAISIPPQNSAIRHFSSPSRQSTRDEHVTRP